MIEVTTKISGRKVYINPFWIEFVANDNGSTRIWIHTDNADNDSEDFKSYFVAESVEEVIKKIEDDRR